MNAPLMTIRDAVLMLTVKGSVAGIDHSPEVIDLDVVIDEGAVIDGLDVVETGEGWAAAQLDHWIVAVHSSSPSTKQAPTAMTSASAVTIARIKGR